MKLTKTIDENQIVLLVFKGGTDKVMLELCKEYSCKDIGLILFSQSAEMMLQKLKKKNVNSSKICFIDCISKKQQNKKNIIYTQDPEALTELSLAISQMIRSKAKKVTTIILDSISTMLIHNTDIMLIRFLHDLVNKIRNTDKKLIFTILAKDNKGSLASVPLFCDAVVKLD